MDFNTSYETSKTFVHGSDASCSNGFGPNLHESIDVTALVKAWDEGYANHGMVLRASETSGSETAYKGFCSRNFNTTGDATSCYDGANPPAGKSPFTTPRTPTLIVSYSVAPSAPSGVSATAGNGSAAVSWNAPSTDGGSPVTGYTVTASPGGATATTAGARTATVNGLTNGTPYTFTVKATNVVGTGSASAASAAVTPRTVPGAPTAVTATAW